MGDEFNSEELWGEIKPKDLTHFWHSDAIKSTGFGKLTQYEVYQNGTPTFSEITNPEHRDVMMKLYNENIVYYDQIIKNAIS